MRFKKINSTNDKFHIDTEVLDNYEKYYKTNNVGLIKQKELKLIAEQTQLFARYAKISIEKEHYLNIMLELAQEDNEDEEFVREKIKENTDNYYTLYENYELLYNRFTKKIFDNYDLSPKEIPLEDIKQMYLRLYGYFNPTKNIF